MAQLILYEILERVELTQALLASLKAHEAHEFDSTTKPFNFLYSIKFVKIITLSDSLQSTFSMKPI